MVHDYWMFSYSRRDSNPYRSSHQILSLARLPIPPPERGFCTWCAQVRRSELMSAPPGAPTNMFSHAELQALYAQGLRSFHVQAEQYRNAMTPA